jgi:DNA-binding MurR/RpiR family transcriptional regulator
MVVSADRDKQTTFSLLGHGSNLSPSEEKVFNYLLENALTDTFLSVTDLAEKAGVSEATVIRFCQKIGFSGFLEFKKAFLQDRLQTRTEPSPYSKITAADEPDIILQKVFAILEDSLRRSSERIDKSAFAKAVEWLADADIMELYAHGGSGHIAQNVAIQYQRQGLRCVVYTDPLVHAMAIQRTRPEDVVVGISHTGETLSVVEAIKTGRKRGLRTIAVTNFPQSALAQSAEVVILTATNDPALFSDAGASRVSQIAALDAIGVAVSVRKRESN